jgi:Integrase zinc binding domain
LSRPEPGPGPGPGLGETEAGLSRAETCLSQPNIIRPSSSPSAVPVLAVVQNFSVGIDYAALEADQSSCEECMKLISSSSLQVQQCKIDNSAVWCDLSTGFARPLVPAAWRPRVFAALHYIAHPGIRASRRLIAARYVWPGVAAEMCRACQDCGRGKVHSQAAAAVELIELPARQFSHYMLILWVLRLHPRLGICIS